ncbi:MULTISPECIES: hypothetical protein [unclassified Dietzia]|uniref:hypothetical protein n=1 Tax=unclassified Dietzia TaxID=2617939 RepID=UPI000D224B28|nr:MULTISPECIES: hypothetical protein [unclassified Dietzia]AVZ39215.1 hypothetical protein CT688_06765 [Dietzia sp. JS16-p6b]QGW24442.1 hypothetical protein GJR88_02171 [Dietzia sp. DQ12-45-1b]
MTTRSQRVFGEVIAAFLVAVLAFVHLPAHVSAQPFAVYLDVVADNPHGESAGGFSTSMTTDREELAAALAVVRAAGVAPERYATLTRQYWLAVGAQNAGIDLAEWEPARGLEANLETVDKVYVNYLRLYNSHDGFWWTGMAGLAGMSFAAGFWDLDEVGGVLSVPGLHEVGTGVGDALSGVPWELAAGMPRDVRLLATAGPTLTRADADWYLHRLLIMQRNIFMDMIPMHEAYLAGGLPAVRELAAGGAYDQYALEAWRRLDEGSPEGRSEALLRMASREQNQIIADQWDATAAGRGDVGRVLTYVTTVGGSPDIPGASTLGGFRPLSVRADVNGRPTVLHTPLPAFNWADREPRWEYIEQDLVPAFRSLVRDRPAEAPGYLDVDFRPRAEQNRILARLPVFAGQMTTGWAIGSG